MKFEEFVKAVITEVEEKFNCKCEVNGDDIIVRLPGINVAPMIHARGVYEVDAPIEEKLPMIVKSVDKAIENIPEFSGMEIANFEKIKGRLFTMFKEKDSKKNAWTFDKVGNYEVIVGIDLEIGITRVNDGLIRVWGVEPEEVYKCARENEVKFKMAIIETMESVAREFENEEMDLAIQMGLIPNDMYVITNTDRRLGATCALYNSTIKSLEQIFDGDYYLFPCSIHEMIAVKELPEGCRDMVKEANEDAVLPEDTLGEDILHWNVEKREYEVV